MHPLFTNRRFAAIMGKTTKRGDGKGLEGKTAYYHLPGLFAFYELYRVFLPLFREHREYFYSWCDIGSLYGAPADCIWGGGRVGFGDTEPRQVLALTEEYPGKFFMTDKPFEAAKDADVIFTDVWASMGQESEKAVREKAFAGYQVNEALLEAAHPGCMVQHCLPAHRGEEITAEVFEAHADEIFDEAENRLHAQKAVLVACMK